MFIDTKNLRVYIYTEVIDMRCGFERLLYFVRIQMKNDINQGHLYLFFGKNRGRFMARLELGDILEITQVELKQIFNGGHIVRPQIDRSTFVKKRHDASGAHFTNWFLSVTFK